MQSKIGWQISQRRQPQSSVRHCHQSSAITDDLSASARGIRAASSMTSISTAFQARSNSSSGLGIVNADTEDMSGLELLEVEDDEEERLATLSSPVKGKKRLTTTVSDCFDAMLVLTLFKGIVKIEPNGDAPRPSSNPVAHGHKLQIVNRAEKKFMNKDLPSGCTTNNVW